MTDILLTDILNSILASERSISITITISNGQPVPVPVPVLAQDPEPSEPEPIKPEPVKPVQKPPEVVPEIPNGYKQVACEAGLYYCFSDGAISIKDGNTTLRTNWLSIKKSAELDSLALEKRLNRLSYTGEQKEIFYRFLKAYKDKRVCPKVAQPVQTPGKWSTIPVLNVGDLEYQEQRGRIRLKNNDVTCYSNWDTVVKLSSMQAKKLDLELAVLFPAPNQRELISSFIHYFKDGLVEDPDSKYRPMVRIDTSTKYDGGKLDELLL